MLKAIILLSICLITLVACNQNSRQALKYTESIVKKEKDLIPSIQKTENGIERLMQTGNMDSVHILSSNMEMLVDAKIREIEATPPPAVPLAQDFREASVKYFQFMKNIYTGYKNMASQQSPGAIQTEQEKLLRIVSLKQAAIDSMQAAQRRFAAANGFLVKNE
jgi:hypothetical protein